MARSGSVRYVLVGIAVALVGVAATGLLGLASPGKARAQPEPTMVISPASGPCDATVEVRGSGFEPPRRPDDPPPRLYLLKPSTADVSMSTTLNFASAGADGTFSAPVRFFELRCEAAALDSQAEQPTGHLFIVASSAQTPVEPGDRIPDIIAAAQYAYTTTAVRARPTMVVSPSSGPCDGTVVVSGTGFAPGETVLLELRRPFSDAEMGVLGSAVPDSAGDFSAEVTLGTLGCEAARLQARLSQSPEPGQLHVVANREAPPATPPRGIPGVLAGVAYTYTTTTVSPEGLPDALPQTGGGPGPSAGSPGWLSLAGALGGLGVILVMASLYGRRKRA